MDENENSFIELFLFIISISISSLLKKKRSEEIIELKRLKEFEEHDRKYASQLYEEMVEAEGTFIII